MIHQTQVTYRTEQQVQGHTKYIDLEDKVHVYVF